MSTLSKSYIGLKYGFIAVIQGGIFGTLIALLSLFVVELIEDTRFFDTVSIDTSFILILVSEAVLVFVSIVLFSLLPGLVGGIALALIVNRLLQTENKSARMWSILTGILIGAIAGQLALRLLFLVFPPEASPPFGAFFVDIEKLQISPMLVAAILGGKTAMKIIQFYR